MSESLGYPDPLYPYGPGSRAPLADAREMPDCYPIKGNVRDDGIRYYHRPDSRSYRATRAEVWFDSPSAAEAAGFTLAPTHPTGSTSAPYEPGGSAHPCSAEAVESNRTMARGGTDDHPYGPGSRAPLADAREMPDCYPIKGNVRDDGIRYYHRPDSRSYRATRAEVWFDSPSAAEAAGFTLAPTHGDGTDGVSYEPGGSNHPCTAATVDANRAAVRALAAGAAPAIAPLVGDRLAGATASGAGPQGEDGMDIEPGRPAHDVERHPFGVGSHAVGDDHRTAPVGYPIKGNVRRDGSRRYHRPDSTAYGTTNAEVWFDSPSAAEAAGFSLAASHPQGADAARFEPGGDGHSWSRAEVGDARIRALYGPDGARGSSGTAPADDKDGVSTAGLTASGLAGAGLLAAGAAALGRLGFDADLHPFGIGSHRLLAKATDTPRFHPIKGNVRNDGGRIYHRPDSTSYSVTKPEVWFDSPSAAETAGFTLSPSHPAGAAASDFEPGGARHPWSADEVNTARLRFLYGPDWSGRLSDLPADSAGGGADADSGTGRAGLAAGAAALAGTAAVAGAGALLGADGDDDGRSAAEKLGATTLELPGPVAASSAIPVDPAVTAPAAANAGEQVTTRLSRPAGREHPGDGNTIDTTALDPAALDPSALDDASAGDDDASAGDDDAARASVGEDDESGHRGAATVAAGVVGLGLAGGAAYLANRGDDDGHGDDSGTGAGDTADTDDTAEAPAGTGAAAFHADETVKAPGQDLASAGTARAERSADDAGRRAASGIGTGGAAATGAALTGAAAAGPRLTALSGGRDGSGADGRRRGGLWAWLAAAAAAIVVLGLLLSMCGGSSNTNEATGGGAKGSDLASSASTEASSAPNGPSTSASGESTTAQQSTTQATAASTSATAAPSTTQAPAGPSTSVNANDDLKLRALAALDAAGFKNVQVEVSSGRVRITGNVPSAADATKAEGALNGMAGLSGVDNALVVAETPTANAVSGDPRYTG